MALMRMTVGTEDPKDFIVVRRDRPDVFRTLDLHFRGESDVRVMWDRRTAERRALGNSVEVDRRQSERRLPPPSSWKTLGILVTSQRLA